MNEEINDTGALPARITIEPEIIFQEIGDEIVLLNLRNEHYYGLDAVGARAWQLLTQPGHEGEVASVVAQLLNEFDVEETVLRRDLAHLFKELSDAGLITQVESA